MPSSCQLMQKKALPNPDPIIETPLSPLQSTRRVLKGLMHFMFLLFTETNREDMAPDQVCNSCSCGKTQTLKSLWNICFEMY